MVSPTQLSMTAAKLATTVVTTAKAAAKLVMIVVTTAKAAAEMRQP